MKVFSTDISLSTKGFCDVHDITANVQAAVKKSAIREVLVTVCVIGSTAAVTTMEFEPNLVKDLQEAVERLVPAKQTYHHNQTWGDDNGFSHIRSSLVGTSLTVPVRDQKLVLGTWQQIVFVDFDNRPRQRQVAVQILGNA